MLFFCFVFVVVGFVFVLFFGGISRHFIRCYLLCVSLLLFIFILVYIIVIELCVCLSFIFYICLSVQCSHRVMGTLH